MKLWAALPATLLIASCSLFGSKEPVKKKDDKDRTRLVGRVASLPSSGGFALIESYGPWDVPAGGILTTAGDDGRGANLTASGEKLGRFAAADIRSGTLQPGDAVYYRVIKEKESSDDSSTEKTKPAVEEKPEENSKKSPEESQKS